MSCRLQPMWQHELEACTEQPVLNSLSSAGHEDLALAHLPHLDTS